MPQTECPPTRRAELFVRADLPEPAGQRLTAVERRLQELQCKGVFDGTATTVWDKRVPVDGGDCRERSLYHEFAEWAGEAGASLSPFSAPGSATASRPARGERNWCYRRCVWPSTRTTN